MFSDITLSSAEDTQILTQYITAAAQDVEAVLKQFITATVITGSPATSIAMTITNTRGDNDFETRTKDLAESYITLNATGDYLAMVHPELAQKYYRDARQRIEMLVAYVFYKKPPVAQSGTIDYNDPSGTVDDDNNTDDSDIVVDDGD